MKLSILSLVYFLNCVVGDGSFLDDLELLHGRGETLDQIVYDLDNTLLNPVGELASIRGVNNLLHNLKEAPPIKLAEPRRIPYSSVRSVKDNLEASFISVCPVEELLKGVCICKERYQKVSVVNNDTSDALAILAVNEKTKTIIISYRPTRTLKNQLTTIDFVLTQAVGAPRYAKVHSGFQDYVFSIKNDIQLELRKALANKKYRNYKIHLTGYSLGATIALIATPHWDKFLKNNGYSNKLLTYAYAGPRPGNAIYAKYIAELNLPIMRYTNREDIISHLPLRSLDFVHAGVEFHERALPNGNTELILCSQDYDEDPNCGLSPHAVFSFARHYFPLNRLVPLPPYC